MGWAAGAGQGSWRGRPSSAALSSGPLTPSRTWRGWSVARAGQPGWGGAGGEQVPGGAAEGAGAAPSGEEEAEGGPHGSLQLPDRRGERGGVGLCSPVTGDRTRGNGLELRQGRFRLEIGENLVTEIMLRLPRAVGESPSLEEFKHRVDVAPGDTVSQAWGCWGDGWTRCPLRSFPALMMIL